MQKSAIERTDATWNPVRGCSRVSPGCLNCYAEEIAARFSGTGLAFEGFAKRVAGDARWTGKVQLIAEKLAEPLRWRKPRRIFVNSMSDLFHEDLPDAAIVAVMDVIRQCVAQRPGHIFQVLTKRPQRMAHFMTRLRFDPGSFDDPAGRIWLADDENDPGYCLGSGWKGCSGLTNLWLGVSCENQETAEERIPWLLECPAAVRFLSLGPLLGPISFADGPSSSTSTGGPFSTLDLGIHWVVVEGETGPGARPMHPDWVRSLRDQCVEAGVPFFFKQWGGRRPKAAGRLLDGREWNEFPEPRS